jgi:hypothetical protein
MLRVKRTLAIGATALALLVTMAHPAIAGTPANHACLGHDLSGYAQGGSGFGGFISGIGSTTQGVGTEIQAHLAGLVPDTTIPNTCND